MDVGFVWDVMPNLSVSADYWAIKLEDMIVDVGADEVLASEAGCLTGKNIDGTPWPIRPVATTAPASWPA